MLFLREQHCASEDLVRVWRATQCLLSATLKARQVFIQLHKILLSCLLASLTCRGCVNFEVGLIAVVRIVALVSDGYGYVPVMQVTQALAGKSSNNTFSLFKKSATIRTADSVAAAACIAVAFVEANALLL